MSGLTYAQLSSVLVNAGFARRVIKGSHVLFTYPAREVIVMLPIVRGDTKARPAHVVATRFTLDANGIVSKSRWEKLVRTATRQAPDAQ